MAYQIAFDLCNNAPQQFRLDVRKEVINRMETDVEQTEIQKYYAEMLAKKEEEEKKKKESGQTASTTDENKQEKKETASSVSLVLFNFGFVFLWVVFLIASSLSYSCSM